MKAIIRILGVLIIVAGTVLLGGCHQPSGGGGSFSIIGTWLSTTDLQDAMGAGVDYKAGSTVVIGVGTYATTYTADDNGTEYNCSHSGTFTPTDPDSSTTLLLTVEFSDGDGSDYYPPDGSNLQFIYSSLTATTVNLGVDMDNNGSVDMTLILVRQ